MFWQSPNVYKVLIEFSAAKKRKKSIQIEVIDTAMSY